MGLIDINDINVIFRQIQQNLFDSTLIELPLTCTYGIWHLWVVGELIEVGQLDNLP